MLDTSELDDKETRVKFETEHHGAIALSKEILQKNTKGDKTVTNPSDNSTLLNRGLLISSTRLPKIDLPKFDGSYNEWFPFHDTFCSLIHENDDISRIQKFHYLKSCLSGEAKNILQLPEISGEN